MPNTAFVKAALLNDVPPGAPVEVNVEGKAIALYNLKGTIYATDAACAHAHVSL